MENLYKCPLKNIPSFSLEPSTPKVIRCHCIYARYISLSSIHSVCIMLFILSPLIRWSSIYLLRPPETILANNIIEWCWININSPQPLTFFRDFQYFYLQKSDFFHILVKQLTFKIVNLFLWMDGESMVTT